MQYSDMNLSSEMECIWQTAGRIARRYGYAWIEPPHLMIAFVSDQGKKTLPSRMLLSYISARKVRDAMKKLFSLRRTNWLPPLTPAPLEPGECLTPILEVATLLADHADWPSLTTELVGMALFEDPAIRDALLEAGLGPDFHIETCNELARRGLRRDFSSWQHVSALRLVQLAQQHISKPSAPSAIFVCPGARWLPLSQSLGRALEIAAAIARNGQEATITLPMLLVGIGRATACGATPDAIQQVWLTPWTDIQSWLMEHGYLPRRTDCAPMTVGWNSYCDQETNDVLYRGFLRALGVSSEITPQHVLLAAEETPVVKRIACWLYCLNANRERRERGVAYR